MDSTQKFTPPAILTDEKYIPRPYSQLTNVQRAYVDYKAVGGLLSLDDEDVKPLTVQQLADELGVTRRAIYAAKEDVPNFWDLVAERRKELSGRSRLTRVHQALYLYAKKGSYQHMQLYLAYFDDAFPMKTEGRKGDDIDSLAEAMNVARQRRLANEAMENKAIEGEVISDNKS